MKQITERQYRIVELQMMYLSRPYCHVKEGFRDKLIENIQEMLLPEKLEVSMLAYTIKAMGCGPKDRKALFDLVLDWLEAYARITGSEWVEEGE